MGCSDRTVQSLAAQTLLLTAAAIAIMRPRAAVIALHPK